MKSRRFLVVTVLLAGVGAISAFAQSTKPKVMSHDAAGREQCLMCHTAGAMEAVPDAPASHEGRAVETCLMCHAADSPVQTADPKPIPHALEGRDNCAMCHTAGAMEAVPDTPASHEGWDVKYCTLCHKAAG
jgi:ligand-binding sensor protein